MKNIIEKFIEKLLNKKFGAIIVFFQSQNSAFKILVDGRDNSTSNIPETPDSDEKDKILNKLIEIDFVQKKNPVTDVITIYY